MEAFESQFRSRLQFPAAFIDMAKTVLPAQIGFELAVMSMAIGIGLYFAWPTEPSLWVIGLVLGLSLALLRFIPDLFAGLILCFVFMCAGLAWSVFNTAQSDTNPLLDERRYTVTGWVSDIEQQGGRSRLRIELTAIDPVPDTGMPSAVRIRGGRVLQSLDVGEHIAIEAVLGPLPGPAVPNGYDPARRAFFDGLAGSGFAISDPQRLTEDMSVRARLQRLIHATRHTIADHVMARAPDRTAGLQAALLTGIRHHIPDDQTDSLRASGLAHILAISGLHMGLVAFGVFFTISLALAAIEPFSRGQDVRKIAAFIAIIAATLYLGLSGASVATQRAYIMVCVAFTAILLDRRAISIRSVAVAAFLTLLLRPEALTSVGFQMSFAAVAAMVVIFRAWDRWRPHHRSESFRDRIKRFYGSLFGTSLIAGFATGGFALLHFGRFANYGLLANMAAMSVFPLVMALGIISLMLMPLGLDGLPLWLMGMLIEMMLRVSDWVSGLPGAVGTVKASAPLTIATYGLGFALACFATRRAVIIGCGVMAISLCLWVMTPRADMRISKSGRVSLIDETLAVTSSAQADRYGREQFARASGEPELSWRNYHDDFANCDALACRFTHKDHVVTIVEAPSEVPDACRDSDLVVLVDRDAGPVARRGCQAMLIDQRVLSRTGGVHLIMTETLTLVPIIHPNRRNRPWGKGRRR